MGTFVSTSPKRRHEGAINRSLVSRIHKDSINESNADLKDHAIYGLLHGFGGICLALPQRTPELGVCRLLAEYFCMVSHVASRDNLSFCVFSGA